MKKLFLTLFFCQLTDAVMAQSTTITPGGSQPIIYSNTTSNGIQLPKLSPQNIFTIIKPSSGVMVYDTVSKCPRYFNGSVWQCLNGNISNVLDPNESAWGGFSGNEFGTFSSSMKTDNGNNVIMAGHGVSFTGTNGLIAKFSNTGTQLWARSISAHSYVDDIDINQTGNIYSSGTFWGTLSLDGITLTGNGTSQGFGNGDLFIAKQNNNGTFQWINKISNVGGINGLPRITRICADTNENVYVLGSFSTPFSLAGFSLTPNGTDLFLVKYDTNGNFQWINHIGGAGEQLKGSVATDSFGNVFICGSYTTEINNDGVPLFYFSDGHGVFIASFDGNGSYRMATAIGHTGNAQANDIAFDGLNNVFIVGNFDSSIAFSPTLGPTLTSNGLKDIFLIKLNPSNNSYFDFKFLKQFGSSQNDDGRAIHVSTATNNAYLTGDIFYKNTLGQTDSKLLYLKLDNDGNTLETFNTPYLSSNIGTDIVQNSTGVFTLVSRSFETTLTFGTSTITNSPAPIVVRRTE